MKTEDVPSFFPGYKNAVAVETKLVRTKHCDQKMQEGRLTYSISCSTHRTEEIKIRWCRCPDCLLVERYHCSLEDEWWKVMPSPAKKLP